MINVAIHGLKWILHDEEKQREFIAKFHGVMESKESSIKVSFEFYDNAVFDGGTGTSTSYSLILTNSIHADGDLIRGIKKVLEKEYAQKGRIVVIPFKGSCLV